MRVAPGWILLSPRACHLVTGFFRAPHIWDAKARCFSILFISRFVGLGYLGMLGGGQCANLVGYPCNVEGFLRTAALGSFAWVLGCFDLKIGHKCSICGRSPWACGSERVANRLVIRSQDSGFASLRAAVPDVNHYSSLE